MIFRRLLLAFIVVPIGELALLIQLGRWIGLWPTLAIIVTTGIVGAALAGREGLRAWQEFQTEISQGRMPGRPILDGFSIFAGGAMLLTPGLLTDLLGFSLLLRPTRRFLQDRVMKRLGRSMMERGQVYVHTQYEWRGPEGGGSDQRRSGRPKGREIDSGAGESRLGEGEEGRRPAGEP